MIIRLVFCSWRSRFVCQTLSRCWSMKKKENEKQKIHLYLHYFFSFFFHCEQRVNISIIFNERISLYLFTLSRGERFGLVLFRQQTEWMREKSFLIIWWLHQNRKIRKEKKMRDLTFVTHWRDWLSLFSFFLIILNSTRINQKDFHFYFSECTEMMKKFFMNLQAK